MFQKTFGHANDKIANFLRRLAAVFVVVAMLSIGMIPPEFALAAPPGAPSPPWGLTAARGTFFEEVDLDWEAPASQGSSSISEYRIYRDGQQVAAISPQNTKFTDEQSTPDSAKSYHVTAINSNGESDASNIASATAPGRPSPPALVSGNDRHLDWNPPSSDGGKPISEYRAYVSVDGGPFEPLADGIAGTDYEDRCIVQTVCRYWVTAVNTAGGESAASTIATVAGWALPSTEALLSRTLHPDDYPPDSESLLIQQEWADVPADPPYPTDDGDPVGPSLECDAETDIVAVVFLGPSCHVPGTPVYKIFHTDGSESYAHYPNDSTHAAFDHVNIVPRKPLCVDNPSSQHYFKVLYAYDDVTELAFVEDDIRATLDEQNGFFRGQMELSRNGERFGDIKFLCEPGGRILIDSVALHVQSPSLENFDSVKKKLNDLGYWGNPREKYLVFVDFDNNGPCGTGEHPTDKRKQENNRANQGDLFALVFDQENDQHCFDVALHEMTHTMGAVQGDEDDHPPNKSYHGHCNDGWDPMCYNDRNAEDEAAGKPILYSTSVCSTTEFDCGGDDYFNPSPPCPGSWLCDHWNVGGIRPGTTNKPMNNWLYWQDDCGANEAGDDHSTATGLFNLPRDCIGTLAAGDSSDWYYFSASAGDRISASALPQNPYVEPMVCLYDALAEKRACNAGTQGSESKVSHVVPVGQGGYWRAKMATTMTAEARKEGEYQMKVSLKPTDCGAPGDDAPNAPSGHFLTADIINCAGSLSDSDQADWYAFTVSSTSKIQVTVREQTEAQDYDICLYAPGDTQNPVLCDNDTFRDAELVFSATSTGTWRFTVAPWEHPGRYIFSLRVIPENDCGVSGDAPEASATAPLLALPVTKCKGFLAPTEDGLDWYKFPMTAGQWVSAELQMPKKANFNLCIQAPGGTRKCGAAPTGVTETVHRFKAASPGDYRILISRFSGGGEYLLTARTFLAQSDASSGEDAGGRSKPVDITLPKIPGLSGKLYPGDNDKEDWYRFNVPDSTGRTIKLQLSFTSPRDFDLCLYRFGLTRAVKCSQTIGAGTSETIEYNPSTSGTWYARVAHRAEQGTYTLRACLFPDTATC